MPRSDAKFIQNFSRSLDEKRSPERPKSIWMDNNKP
jgi:hypothetical protein